MKTGQEFYQEQIKENLAQVAILKGKLRNLSLLRLFTFLAAAAGVYYTVSIYQVAIIIAVVGIAVFLWLVAKYATIKDEKKLKEALVALNEKELTILAGNFYNEPDGEHYKNPKHFYSLDIDLFGKGSFFQYLNRTGLAEGSNKLAQLLTANAIDGITSKQEVVKELSTKPLFRQYYTAAASLIKTETPNSTILNWVKSYTPFTKSYFVWAAYAVSGASILLFVLALLEIVPSSWVGFWLSFGLAITARSVKKVNELSANTSKAKETFKQYAQLLMAIENEEFTTEVLKAKQQQIGTATKKASEIFREFSKLLDTLDNRNNLIGALFGNGFFLMDLRNSYRIEQWMDTYKDKVADWFEVVAWFDAYNSLGNLAFNKPEYVYPTIVNNSHCIKAEELGHPLLKTEKRVDNTIGIDNQQFFIITGANMAGKSTFLRTVSLHIVMANIGLPVCAKNSEYTPVKLITSMRTTDSLTDDSSYFFSELTRLKYIVDALQTDRYFVILDEILKGTNSTDKAIGSKKFVEKLVAGNATGIIATHDLSLCEIEQELPQVKNYYFDAEIVNDELFFDYRFKKGICQNMNASFLLRKMEII